MIVILLPFMDHHRRGVCPDYTTSSSLLSTLWWFLLDIFSCGKSFLLVFRSFSEIVAL